MSQTDQTLKLPTHLYLETTNRCNLRCRGCILYNGKREPERDITLQDFFMITDQLEDLERATLHGVGEPLLNEQLPAMARHLKKRNVYTLFNSNGILLEPKRQHELIESGLDELRISLDAATAAGYKKIRNSNQFNRIVENLHSLSKLQKARSLTRPKLSLWFLGTKGNISELPDFVKLAADIGICEVYLQRLVYYHDAEGYGVAREDKSLQDTDHKSLELIQQSQELAEYHGLRFNASGLSQPLESIQSDAAKRKPWSRCYRPQRLIYITANGNVLPCCIAPFATVDYASLILGNVYESSLKDIWLGTKYQNFRDQLQTADPPQCCQGCGVLWSL
jgi:radical SAM protein with 4Fe4S-binding SPASM domain